MSDEAERERIARDRYLEMNDNGPEWSAVPPAVREQYLVEADDVLAASPPRRTRMPAALGAEYGGYVPQSGDPYDAMVEEKVFGKKPVTTYMLVGSVQIEALEQKVNAKLAEGWEVSGGVAITTAPVISRDRQFIYIQAMIRRDTR